MRVLLLSQQFDIRGGSDVMVHATKRLLEKAGHDVHLFAATPEEDDRFPSDGHFEKPSLKDAHRFFYHAEAARKLDRLLEENPVDIAHAHIYYGKLTPAILGPLKDREIPLVHHLHEYRSFCSISVPVRNGKSCTQCSVGSYWPGLRFRCNRGSLARSMFSTLEMYAGDALGVKSYPAKMITVSDFQRNLLIKQGMPAERMVTVGNPVASAFFGIEHRGGGGVLFAGRLEDYKGIFDLLDTAARMPDTRFVVVGDGEARPRVEREIARQGLDNVDLVGHVDRPELLAHLQAADVAFVPSIADETFGLTAGEAMAADLPVIASDAGALPEVVKHGVTGFVVPRGDIDGYVERLSSAVSGSNRAREMGRAGRERIARHFSEEAYRNRLLAEFDEVLNRSQQEN